MKNKSYTFASQHNPSQNSEYSVWLDNRIIENMSILKPDTFLFYAKIQAKKIKIEDISDIVPEENIEELISIGYLKEVEE